MKTFNLLQSQLSMFIEWEMNPDLTQYNIALRYNLPNSLEYQRLYDSITTLVKNHPELSTRIIKVEQEIKQYYHLDEQIAIDRKKIGSKEDLESYLTGMNRPFDLFNEALIRISLIKHNDQIVFALAAHHIIFDGATLKAFTNELNDIYSQNEVTLDKTSLREYVEQEEKLFKGEEYQVAAKYYYDTYYGIEPPKLSTQTDSHKGVSVSGSSYICRQKIDEFCSKHNLTANSLFLAAYGYVTSAMCNNKHFYIATTNHGRHNHQCDNSFGMFAKTAPSLINIKNDQTIAQFIQSIRDNGRNNIIYGAYPFTHLCRDLKTKPTISYSFQGSIVERETSLLGQTTTMEFLSKGATNSDLVLYIYENGDKYEVLAEASDANYSADYLQQFASRVLTTIENILKDVDAPLSNLSVISESEKREILTLSQGDNMEYDSDKTFVDTILEHSTTTPKATAIVDSTSSISYQELATNSNIVAHKLRQLGVKNGEFVGIMLPRCKEFMVSVIGVMRAGGAYVPMDAEYPNDRLEYMLSDSESKILITTRPLFEKKKEEGNFSGENVIYIDELESINTVEESINLAIPKGNAYMIYTSGSTGLPKGVVISHESLNLFASWCRNLFELGSNSKDAQYLSFSFDGSLLTLIPVLYGGGELHIIGENIRYDIEQIYQYFIDKKITGSCLSTQLGMAMLNRYGDLPLKYLAVGGEKLLPTRETNTCLINLYGPTEFTVASSYHIVKNGEINIPIGRPTPLSADYIVDSNGNLLPRGVAGELCLAGKQIAKGYWKREELTKEKFVDCKFVEGEKMYRTGDLARWNEDGELEFLGRIDNQVKLRGFRIELGEIESKVQSYEGVNSAVVVVKLVGGVEHLCAYYQADFEVDKTALKEHLSSSLTEYMVPSLYMQLESMPLTPNGKINTKALPTPEIELEEVVEATNEKEAQLLRIATGLLQNDKFGVTNNLISLGMTSLLAMRFSLMVSNQMGVKLETKNILQKPTIRELASTLTDKAQSHKSYERREFYPLTENQNGLYISWEQNREGIQYNTPTVIKFSSLEYSKLLDAIKQVIELHPNLKSRLARVKNEVMVVRRDESCINIIESKVDAIPTKDELQKRVRPFDLFKEDLTRIELIKYGESVYMFMDVHHIIYDGGSVGVFFHDLHKIYCNEAVTKEVATAFDRAISEKEILSSDKLEQLESYFDNLVGSYSTTSYPSTAEPNIPSKNVACRVLASSAAISDRAKAIGVTQSNYFLASTLQVLHLLTREQNVMITSISNGRSDIDYASSIGMFVKTLPVVSSYKNEKFETIAQEVQQQMIESISRDIYPFTRLSERHNVGVEIMFAYEQNYNSYFEFNENEIETIPIELDMAKMAVSITVSPYDSQNYEILVEYDSALYSNESMMILAESIKNFALHAATANQNVNDISLLDLEQKNRIISVGRGKTIEYDKSETFIDLWLKSVAKFPDNTAIVDEVSKISYRELDNASNFVASKLIETGVLNGEFVGVMTPRRKEFHIAALAIMKAGGAYVPMDSAYPNDRILHMLNDSESKVLITTHEIYDQKCKEGDFEVENVIFIEELEFSALAEPINNTSPDGLAYMIYTSGSTGLPKGVMIPHKAFRAYIAWRVPLFGLTPECRNSQHPSFSFDTSIDDLLVPLTVGAQVHILNQELRQDISKMYEYIKENQITGMTVSTLFGMELINTYPEISLNYMELGGEKMLPVSETPTKLFNGYGPTEFTITSSAHVVKHDETDLPIGKSCPNSSAYIIGMNGDLTPYGVAGELCLAGVQIAYGYWHREELTREKFIDCPYQSGKMYRTGDLARWNENGELECLGRIDTQVKLRGYRIELGEIESAMQSYENIISAVVDIKEIAGAQHLCGYFTSASKIDIEKLTAHISESLTEYMVPTEIMQIEAIPLTPNGKIDRKRLPLPKIARTVEYIAPRNELEKIVCEIYQKLLKLDEVGIKDDYFTIGGTSISAIRVVIELTNMGYELTYGELFKLKTAENIAAHFNNSDNDSEIGLFDAASYDYTAINNLLENSYNTEIASIEANPAKAVMLTGAAGYLGVYILKRLLLNNTPKIYCLVRSNRELSALDRVKTIFAYYFSDSFEPFEDGTIEVIEGDITDENLSTKLNGIEFDMVINPAAMVKHFVADDSMDKVNIGGVENLINLCEKKSARLIQISTYSVASVTPSDSGLVFNEKNLFEGQIIDNDYVRTKFLAERALLQAIADGRIEGKVMRVGNLMGRESDGEFQINFHSNAFINATKSYKVLQLFPLSSMTTAVEISPIDRVAESVVALSSTPAHMVLFHPYNCYNVDMALLIKSMNEYGFPIEITDDNSFKSRITELMNDPEKSIYMQGIIHDAGGEERLVETPVTNIFTTTTLYKLGFYWNVTSNNYFTQLIESLDLLGFFDE